MNGRTDPPDNTDRRTRGLRPEPMSPVDARQGFKGKPVLIVLLASMLLAMLIWIPVEWWGNSIAPDTPTEQTAPSPRAESESQNMPESNPTPGQ